MPACNLLWSHATIDVTGEIRPCCRFREFDYELPRLDDGLISAWNGDVFADIRHRMASGEQIPNCEKCWQQERAGSQSLRTLYNSRYPNARQDKKLKFLEIGFSTHCNLACRICNESFSSKWWAINNPGSSVEIGYDIDIKNLDLDLSELEEIKIVGGEPMLVKQHDEFLNLILARSNANVTLNYYTNGTVMPSDRVIEYWSKMKEVYINISIDGVGQINDYCRPGSNWQILHDNIERYHELPLDNLKIRSHSVISVLNLWNWHHFYDWHSRFFADSTMGLDFAESPDHLSLRNMSPELKQKAFTYAKEKITNTNHQTRILQKIHERPLDNKQTTLEEIYKHESKLDAYFNQKNII